MADFEFVDNSAEISKRMKAAIKRALMRIGMQAEGFAKKLCVVATGRLRNSITFEDKV